MRHIGIGIWEMFLLLFALCLGFWALRASTRRVSRVLIAFVIIYLVTKLLWWPLSLFHDHNDRGNHWWTNPWGGYIMHWWLWLLVALLVLLGLGNLAAGLASWGWFQRLVGIIGSLLLLLALIGADWLDPWHDFHRQLVRPVAASKPFTCADLKYRYLTVDQPHLHTANTEDPATHNVENDTMIANGIVDQDAYTLRHFCEKVLPRWPVAKFSYTIKPGLRVTYDASASTGYDLHYKWLVDDPNGLGANNVPGKIITWSYSSDSPSIVDKELTKPRLTVTDLYGRQSIVKVPIKLYK